MAKTWVIVASRTHASLYQNDGPGKGLISVRELSHEAARLQDREIDSDKQGRTFDRYGGGRHAKSRSESSHDREAERFAREIADELKRGRTDGRYDRLVLVAEPRFLGMLRDRLDEEAAGRVTATLHKELVGKSPRELEPHLGEVMAV